MASSSEVFMKTAVFALLCFLSLTCGKGIADLGPPAHPATPSQIREYLKLTSAVENAHAAMAQMLKVSRTTSAPYLTPSFWDDMEKAVMGIDIVDPCIPAFQRYFSEEDMAAAIAFYKTAAGQRMLAAQPFVASALGEVLQKAGREAGEKVGLQHKAEIDRLMKEQAPAPATVSPAN
jgi:hypothetical protein